MELSFSELRTKEVVNTNDGRRLGKVCDIVSVIPKIGSSALSCRAVKALLFGKASSLST